jgi:hypothetical protein
MIKRFTVATTASVNDDAISGSSYSRKPYPRRITALGLGGSAAEGDWGVQIRVEGVDMGDYYNLVAGANAYPNKDEVYSLNIPVPANYLVELLVLTAPTTNEGVGIIEFTP